MEHVAILKKGVETWNAWKKENPKVTPDLSGANFSGADLPEVNLSGVGLFQTNFFRANLVRAKLGGARTLRVNFSLANLSHADLYNAKLIVATFSDSNLSYANLSNATLSDANLYNANMEGARLEGVSTARILARSARLDRAFVGEPVSSLAQSLYRQNLIWEVCFTGNRRSFDPDHDPSDSSYWLVRVGKETIYQALLRKLGASVSNAIHLTFQKSVWRDLIVIETGLREVFGEGAETKKTDGALTVSFQSTEDLQRGFEAIFTQLAAKHSQDGQTVDSLVVQGESEDRATLSNEDLLRGFAVLYDKMESIDNKLPAPKPTLTDNQETLARMSESIPFFKWFSHRFRNWLTRPEVREAGEVPVRDLFKWSKEMFRLTGRAPALGDGIDDAEVLEEQANRLLSSRDSKEE